MTIQSPFLFSAAMDVEPSREGLFNEVYDNEHVPLLLAGLQREMTGKNPKSPEYLTQVHYDQKGQKIVWEKGRANFAKEKDLEELAQYLRNRADNVAAAKGRAK